MNPIEFKDQNRVYAKNQPEYMPLPALKLDSGEIIACWKMSFKERIKVLFTGKTWVSLMCFDNPLTPSFISVNRKEIYSKPSDKLTWYKKIFKKK